MTKFKEVRRANKLMQTLETNIDKLHENKMWAGQQLQEQKLRFKNIATVAATRVETMRDLLVNWNFFMETKGLNLNINIDEVLVLYGGAKIFPLTNYFHQRECILMSITLFCL